MAFARSFNMSYSMLQIGINWLIKAYKDHLRLSGLTSKLVKDRYVVLCTVTMTTPKHKKKQNKTQKQTKNTNKQNTKSNNQTNQKKTTAQAKQRHDRFQFMGEMG